ncbi:uncharacterized protein LOC135221287 [Macrobrachium nipponense]|uniref:uncharacterized protein LOC135221287 n=1 Tax=Macrobrachium nipponense TaxID=159736 RepID=UPI0030C8051E
MDSFQKQLEEVTPKTALRRDLLVLDPQETPAVLTQPSRSLRSRGKHRDKEILKRLDQGKTKKSKEEQQKTYEAVEKMSLSMLESNISKIKGLDQTYADVSISDESSLSEINIQAVTRFHRKKNNPRRGLSQIPETKLAHVGKRRSSILPEKKDVSVLKDQTYGNITYIEDTSENDSLSQEVHEKLEKLRSKHRKALSKTELTTKKWVESGKRLKSKKSIEEALPSYKNVRRGRSIVVAEDTYGDLSNADTSSDSISLGKVKVFAGKKGQRQRIAISDQVNLSTLANSEIETSDISVQNVPSNMCLIQKNLEASSTRKASDYIKPDNESLPDSLKGNLSNASTDSSPVKDQNENNTGKLSDVSQIRGSERECEESYTSSTLENSLGRIQTPKKLKLSRKAPPIQLSFSSVWSKLKDKSVLETSAKKNTVDEKQDLEDGNEVAGGPTNIIGQPQLRDLHVVLQRLEDSFSEQLAPYKNEKPVTPPKSFRDDDQSEDTEGLEGHDQSEVGNEVTSKENESTSAGLYIPVFSSDSSDSEVSSNISAALGSLYEDYSHVFKRKSGTGISSSDADGSFEKGPNNTSKENVVRYLFRKSPQKSSHDSQEVRSKMRLRSSPDKDTSQESSRKTTFQKRSEQSPNKGNQQNRKRVPIESVSPQQESNVIMKPSPGKKPRNSFVDFSLQEKMSDSLNKEDRQKRSIDFPKETSSQKKVRVTPLKVNSQNEIHGSAKERNITPRKTSLKRESGVSPRSLPSTENECFHQGKSLLKKEECSPRKASPQKRMSVSPNKASPQKSVSVSPKKASPQKRMSVTPRESLPPPQGEYEFSPRKSQSSKKNEVVSPRKVSRKRMSVTSRKASPQRRMSVSPRKVTPQKRMSVSPRKVSPQKRMSVSPKKVTPQKRMSVSPKKVTPQKRMSVSPRKATPQKRLLIVSPNKASPQKRISVSAKKATPLKRISVTPKKSSPKKKMSDSPKGTSSQIEVVESPLKGSPQNRNHDFLEVVSTHTVSAKIASPQKRMESHSLQESSSSSEGSPRKLRNSSREVSVLEKTEKSYENGVSGAKGDENVSENGGFEIGTNLEIPSSDRTSTIEDTLGSLEKTLVENVEESLERQGRLKQFTETPRKLNHSENISKNESLEQEGNPENASSAQINPQKDTQASVEKRNVENTVEVPGKPSLHKRYSGISMKLSMSESRSDISHGIDEEINISSEKRSSPRKRNPKRLFVTDDITSSGRDVSLKKNEKDDINLSTSRKKSSEVIALKRKSSDTSFVHGELFVGDKNEQGSGKRRRRSSLKRKRSSSREDERGLKSIVHEVLVHPEEAIKAMRKSNYLLGDQKENEDLGSEHVIELQEENVDRARGNTGIEGNVKNNNSTVSNSVVTKKHVEDQRERSDKLSRLPQSDHSAVVFADTQENKGETEGITTYSDKYIQDTPVTRSVEVEGGKDQREENIDTRILGVEEETEKDTQSDRTVTGDISLDGRSTKEDENKNQEKDAPSATVQVQEQGIDEDDDKLTGINEENSAASSNLKGHKSNSHMNDDIVPSMTISGSLSSSVEAEGVPQVVNENEISIVSSQDDELSGFQLRKLAVDVEVGESSGEEELSLNLIPIAFQRRNEKASIQKESLTLTQQEEEVMASERERSEESKARADSEQPSEAPKLIQMTMTNFLTKLAANPPRQSALYDVKESKHFVEAMFRGIERPKTNQTKRPNVKTKKARKEELPLSVPESMTKEIFEHYAKCKVDKNALKTIVKVSEKFWGNCAEDLMSIAKSRGENFVITKEDVIRLMTREGTLSESTPLTSLIVEYLPSEEWDILIPTEYGHNQIYPPLEK